MNYSIYRPKIYFLEKKLRQRAGVFSTLTKKKVREMDRTHRLAYVTRFLVANAHLDAWQAAAQLGVNEWGLHLAGNPTIFIESPMLLEALSVAKYDIDYQAISLPHGKQSVYFSFPNPCTINGVEMKACMFGRINKKYMIHLRRTLEENTGSRFIGADVYNDDKFFIAWTSQKNEGIWVAEHAETLQDVINQGAMAEERHGRYLLNGEELKTSLVMMEMCAKVCLYAKAFPDAIKVGFPHLAVTGEKKKKRSERRAITIMAPHESEGGSTCMHLRRGHFRSLAHKRFKRHPDGSIKVVFVRESVIGGTIDAKTVTKKRPDAPQFEKEKGEPSC